ncbi:MAG: site-2 protease family protein [Aggregatilineales bacterium]
MAFLDFIIILVATVFVLLVSMTIHEFAHNAAANWWGDPTPSQMGKLTLNPLAHITPTGWVLYLAMFILLGGFVGQWGNLIVIVLFVAMFASRGNMSFLSLGQAAINPRMMRDPRWGMFWTTAAGPLSNFALGFISAVLLRLFSGLFSAPFFFSPQSVVTPPDAIGLLLSLSVFYNIFLGVFNLLPFFPIDGWHMMLSLLPGRFMNYKDVPEMIRTGARPVSDFLQQPAYKWQQWRQLSQMVFFALLIFSFFPGVPSILGMLINEPTSAIFRLFMGF